LNLRLPFSRLSIFFLVLIVIGFFILSLDYPKSILLTHDSLRNRTIAIGYGDNIANDIRIEHIHTWYTIQKEKEAVVHIEFIFQNSSPNNLTSTAIFIFPKSSEFNFANSEANRTREELTDSARVVHVPFHVQPGNVHTINFQFEWKEFAHETRYKQWEFYVVTRPDHPGYQGTFYRLTSGENPIVAVQEVNMGSTGYRITEHHPSDAIDFPVLTDWHFENKEYLFTINGSYIDEKQREYLEPAKQLGFYLPISGFVGIPIDYFRNKDKK
jgi:hypothetical protein